MPASISRADDPPDMANPTSAEEAIDNRGNGPTATVSETGSQRSDSSTYDYYLQRSAVPREQSQPGKQPPPNQPPVLHTNEYSQELSAAARGEPHPDKTATVPPDSGRFKKVKRHADRVLRKVKDIKNHLRKPISSGLGLFAKGRNLKVTTNIAAATLGKEASSTSKPTTEDPCIPSYGHRMPEQPQNETRSSTGALT